MDIYVNYLLHTIVQLTMPKKKNLITFLCLRLSAYKSSSLYYRVTIVFIVSQEWSKSYFSYAVHTRVVQAGEEN